MWTTTTTIITTTIISTTTTTATTGLYHFVLQLLAIAEIPGATKT